MYLTLSQVNVVRKTFYNHSDLGRLVASDEPNFVNIGLLKYIAGALITSILASAQVMMEWNRKKVIVLKWFLLLGWTYLLAGKTVANKT